MLFSIFNEASFPLLPQESTVIPRPAAPGVLPTLKEIDDHLAFLKRDAHVWREFRKVVAAREQPESESFGPDVLFVGKQVVATDD